MRTRGDEVARENITQKGKKKKKGYRRSQLLIFLSGSSSSYTPLSSAPSLLFRLQCAEPIEEREREREAGKEMEKETEGRWRRGMKE